MVPFRSARRQLPTQSALRADITLAKWIVVPSGAGGCIIRDLLLLGAALWITAESLGVGVRKGAAS